MALWIFENAALHFKLAGDGWDRFRLGDSMEFISLLSDRETEAETKTLFRSVARNCRARVVRRLSVISGIINRANGPSQAA
jgi:hypothetical protein